LAKNFTLFGETEENEWKWRCQHRVFIKNIFFAKNLNNDIWSNGPIMFMPGGIKLKEICLAYSILMDY
jgi:hypothetical protein